MELDNWLFQAVLRRERTYKPEGLHFSTHCFLVGGVKCWDFSRFYSWFYDDVLSSFIVELERAVYLPPGNRINMPQQLYSTFIRSRTGPRLTFNLSHSCSWRLVTVSERPLWGHSFLDLSLRSITSSKPDLFRSTLTHNVLSTLLLFWR